MKKIFLLIIVSLLSINSLFCQREANIWYFGNYAGIDFNSGVPVPLLDGALNRWEGVASMSDSLGNLLMYTDGEVLWDAQHEIMPNGTGLLGHQSSTECAIIVPYPQNDSLYYVFTVDREGKENGLCYSLVNMNLNFGRGDITSIKNILMITPVPEKVTAIKHHNNKDIWLITHGWETDSFFVYTITEEGLNPIPQIFEVGDRHEDLGISGNNAVGYLRASPDGTRLASVLQVKQKLEIFDFDNSTGIVSNPITIPDTAGGLYGVEFSADVSKLYATSKYYLYQIDLEAGTEQDIINSLTLIGSSPTSDFFGSLQLATDGKIYLAHQTSDYLGVINNPSGDVSSCDFQLFGFHLAGRQSMMGLPNFIQTYFLPPDFKYVNKCFGDSTSFYIPNVTGIDSVFWDFGDAVSGIQNYSKLFSPKHLFSSDGNFSVTLKIYRLGVEYPKNQIIQINSLPEISFGNDTIICFGDTLKLNVYSPFCNYLWYNNSTDSSINITEQGKYWVNVTNPYTNCSNSDTILLSFSPLPEFSLGNDTSFCLNDSMKLGLNYQNAEYLWNTSSSDSIIFVKNAGQYWLQITDSLNCTNSDTIVLSSYNLSEINIGNDTIICPKTEIQLSAYQKDASYLWSTGEITSDIFIQGEGIYYVNITDSVNCINSDTILVTKKFLPEFSLGNDTVICDNELFFLNLNLENVSYLWNNNSTFNSMLADEEGYYSVEVTNVCGKVKDSILVNYKYCGNIYIPNIITPNGDNINDYFKIKGIENEAWKLEIFNRWGNLVFSSDDYQNDWKAENCSDGVYYYLLNNEQFKLQFDGFVHVFGN